METGQKDTIPKMTEAIRARLVAQWEAWKNQDAASNDAVIADEFDSFWPDAPAMWTSPRRSRCGAYAAPSSSPG
jgi:hypothetical protein